jgi:hypothetical protein
VSEPQLHLHLEEATPADRQPLRTLDVAEADASECFWPGCEASPSFHNRVMIGRDSRPVLEDGTIVGWDKIDWKPVPWNPSKKEVDWVFSQCRREFEIGDQTEEPSEEEVA